jgi:hypothetical protein
MRYFLLPIIAAIALIVSATSASAQMMGNALPTVTDDHTAREEAEGREIWQQLQSKQLTCDTLSDIGV